MAFQSAMTSASGICKPFPSTLTSSSSTGRLVRRRGRGSLVRCRAFVWSREDLDRLHALSMLPRHQLTTDVVEQHVGEATSFGKSFSHSLDSDQQQQQQKQSISLDDNILSTSQSDLNQHDYFHDNFPHLVEQKSSPPGYREYVQDDNDNNTTRQVKLDNNKIDDDDNCSSSSDIHQSNTNTQPHSITGISATFIDLSL